MLVFGIILAVGGGVLLAVHVFKKRRLAVLLATDRKKAAELLETAKAVGGEIGGGSFREIVELAGQIECAKPLVSPLGQRPCVYYQMGVRREYEEEYYDNDSQGNRVRRTRRGSESVSDAKEWAEFQLRDESGAITVAPEGADFDPLVESVSRFEPAGSGASSISFGGFSFSLGPLSTGRRTLGFRYEERILPADRRVIVVGQVSDADGRVSVRRGGPQFIVTTRSKEELVESTKKAAFLLLVIGIGLDVAGLALVVAGLVSNG